MVLLGNILLGIAALLLVVFTFETFGKSAPGGDAGVGWAWAIVLYHFATFVCLALVAAIIGSQGGFAWVSASSSGVRFLWVAGGLLVALLGAMFAGFREGGPMLAWLGTFVPATIHLSLIIGFGMLLNGGTAYRLPLLLAAGLGAVPCGLLLSMSLKIRAESYLAAAKSIGKPDQNDLRMIAQIERHDVSKNISNLLIYTDYNKEKWVREPALTKIKSRPDWQQELVSGLQDRWAPEVFTFLAGNEVDDKSLFAEPLHAGILMQAELIREKIDAAYQKHHLYDGQFLWETERVLKTLERFEGNGQDYRPEMLKLREAFDAPCKTQKPDFVCKKYLDKWLKKH
ncbi:MAG: hypothetical protein H6574_08890 [Lewinellaceae bacterium]|nr:hypothetical protein [Saprospiraceae bacterium]MCB9331182.1 hypothetical protein [Lewinellaceae bacterium]